MWKPAKTPPIGINVGWSKDVVVMTNYGDVFVMAYYHGKDGGNWQQPARLNTGEKVEWWIELPNAEEASCDGCEFDLLVKTIDEEGSHCDDIFPDQCYSCRRNLPRTADNFKLKKED